MPTSPNSDETPAWIKGDLPAGPVEPEQVHEPQTPLTLETFHEAPNGAESAAHGAAMDDVASAASHEPSQAAERPTAEPPAAEALSLEALIESLLFVADGAVPVGRLAEALEVPTREVEAALTAMSQVYRQRGLSLQRVRDKVQLTTSPSAAAQVERFLGLAAASPLSRAALETLAIVAYQQPVTRPQIEAVRGVNADSVIKNLLSKGLIEESGRAEGPGRPVLYSTTPEFMQHFGLATLSDLPPLSLPGLETAAAPERIQKG
jgi:segregation and condensation protein B